MDTVLTPGYSKEPKREKKLEEKYLIKDKYLSEYSEKEKKALRTNLGVLSKEDTYTKQEVEKRVFDEIALIIKLHLSQEDPHKVLERVQKALHGYIHSDGTTPFTAPLEGQNPTKKEHLTTKEYVDKLLYLHTVDGGVHDIKQQIKQALDDDPFHQLVYTKKEVYTKKQVGQLLHTMAEHYDEEIRNLHLLITQLNSALTATIKASLRSEKPTVLPTPIKGRDPINDNDFTTKKYVDGLIYQHLIDKNAHNITNTEKH